jgi:hypothetical protein
MGFFDIFKGKSGNNANSKDDAGVKVQPLNEHFDKDYNTVMQLSNCIHDITQPNSDRKAALEKLTLIASSEILIGKPESTFSARHQWRMLNNWVYIHLFSSEKNAILNYEMLNSKRFLPNWSGFVELRKAVGHIQYPFWLCIYIAPRTMDSFVRSHNVSDFNYDDHDEGGIDKIDEIVQVLLPYFSIHSALAPNDLNQNYCLKQKITLNLDVKLRRIN